eukprot:gnl/Carplike_NY0171/8346_a11574_196.p1 GENE.gnl/Carplike_NY0171/8346_a11574_196~~gnl/Carplike_NY0171/8346_a11574_196.p1  ORF type:complete len:471 (-),score=90.31 gnl/Carplike_NY0171/8346_a11574_196:177-1544(-)
MSRTLVPISFRISLLKLLLSSLESHKEDICDALHADLHKSTGEALLTEYLPCREDLRDAISNLKEWVKPRSLKTPIFLKPKCKAALSPEPIGPVFVISPWNYPFSLAFIPVIGAIASGNPVVLKASTQTENTTKILREVFRAIDVPVVEGDSKYATELLKYRWAHIFYTGGPRVARTIYSEAAKHLTPVSLELGGKSPCIVSNKADINKIAKRIVFGKFSNAGQTCVAPDYIVVVASVAKELVTKIQEVLKQFYSAEPSKLDSGFGHVVSKRRYDHLCQLIATSKREHDEDSVTYTGSVACDPAIKFIAPHIVFPCAPDSCLLKEEIFGPILPVVCVDSFEAAIDFVCRDMKASYEAKPLAVYLFTNDPKEMTKAKVIPGGSFVVNECNVQAGMSSIPFGGIGESGIGGYHGKWSFDTFSHLRPTVVRYGRIELDKGVRYPPYNAKKIKMLEKTM